MTAVCLQVRLDSVRLPGKALLKIEDLTIIEHAMRALGAVNADLFLILTTDECTDQLKPLAEKWNFKVFTGPENDVLLRFVQAAEFYKIDTVIRATGDNPLVSSDLANDVLAEHFSSGAEYTNWTNAPLGTGIEVVEAAVLKEALSNTDLDYDHEHVTPWIYNNPDLYKLNIHSVPDELVCMEKVSVDTLDDLKKMENIFSALYRGLPIGLCDLLSYLKQEK